MTILTKFKQEDFESILSNYSIGKYLESKHIPIALTNTVYKVKTTKGEYIIKLFEKENRKLKLVKFQTKIMSILTDADFSTPKLIRSNNGRDFIIFNQKPLMIQEFFNGKHPKKLNNSQIKFIGESIAKLHELLKNVKKAPPQFKFRYWNKTVLGFPIGNEYNKILKEFTTIPKSKLKKGVIHGDLTLENLMINSKGKIVFMDWDGIRNDYYAYELGIFISHSFITSKIIQKDQLKLFLKSYQDKFPLNNYEKKAIYYFIILRILGAVDWGESQLRKHQDRKKKLKPWMKEFIGKYKLMKKISTNEFVEQVTNIKKKNSTYRKLY